MFLLPLSPTPGHEKCRLANERPEADFQKALEVDGCRFSVAFPAKDGEADLAEGVCVRLPIFRIE